MYSVELVTVIVIVMAIAIVTETIRFVGVNVISIVSVMVSHGVTGVWALTMCIGCV